ncbi:MAG: hypothetical protein Q8Q62_03850, partial [Mesorhizobium sp.]|nr:hypothetical protein [Mesorhizobium sp.]
MSAISRFAAKVRPSAAETARKLSETLLLATDIIKRPCGTLFNQSPGEPDQLFCSYRAGWEHRCPYRFSS